MENSSPPMRLSRRTLLEIYRDTNNRQAALDNPHGFAGAAVGIIKHRLADQLVGGVKYEKKAGWYEVSQVADEVLGWEDDSVRSRIKLPDWFTIDTPIGRYDPDWAIVIDSADNGEPTLCLVRETRGRPLAASGSSRRLASRPLGKADRRPSQGTKREPDRSYSLGTA